MSDFSAESKESPSKPVLSKGDTMSVGKLIPNILIGSPDARREESKYTHDVKLNVTGNYSKLLITDYLIYL